MENENENEKCADERKRNVLKVIVLISNGCYQFVIHNILYFFFSFHAVHEAGCYDIEESAHKKNGN